MNERRWKIPLECRYCGNTGEAVFSHDRETGTSRIEYLPGGFEVSPTPEVSKVLDIVCAECHRSALPRSWHVRDLWRAVGTILPWRRGEMDSRLG